MVHQNSGNVRTGYDLPVGVLEQFSLLDRHAELRQAGHNLLVPLIPSRPNLVQERIEPRRLRVHAQSQKVEFRIARPRLNREFNACQTQPDVFAACREEARASIAVVMVRQREDREITPLLRQLLRREGSV